MSRPIQKYAQIKQGQFDNLLEKHTLPEIIFKAGKTISRVEYVEAKKWWIRC